MQVDLGEEKREVGVAEVEGWCKDNGDIPTVETSAKDAINVDTAFTLAVQRWLNFEEFLDRSNDFCGNTVDLKKLNGPKANTKSGCCS